MSNDAKCPFNHTAGGGTTNRDWFRRLLDMGTQWKPTSPS